MASKLDDLMENPEAAGRVPPEEIPVLLCRIAAIQGLLLTRLATTSPADASSREGDQTALLTIEDACALLKIQPDYLYRHWKKISGAMKIAGKIRFTREGLRHWTEAQRVR